MSEKLSRDTIIKAVLDTAFARSTGATSLADIANTLHVKKASLYNHFNNREDLITQMLEQTREEAMQKLVASAESLGADAQLTKPEIGKLVAAIDSLVDEYESARV